MSQDDMALKNQSHTETWKQNWIVTLLENSDREEIPFQERIILGIKLL